LKIHKSVEMENCGSDVPDVPFYYQVKVHRLICLELMKFHNTISQIFSAIESSRPRCTSGIPALCLLQVSMDKAKSIIQHCSESSKLYLAITGEKILSRCERIRNTLDSCLSQVQNMVPLLLAAKISGIIHDLRNANFLFYSADVEAGKAVLQLLQLDITATSAANKKELEALRLAALKLKITSPLAVLIEKRSIKRLIDTVNATSPRKKKILKYLLYLLRKYGNVIWQCQNNSTSVQQEESQHEFIDDCGSPEPPQEFKCPISTRLMYDPVIIACGKTFERMWIERWFNECNDTCPITSTKLDHLTVTPNSAMKGLITTWCSKHEIIIPNPSLQPFPASISRSRTCSGSIASFSSFMDDLHLQVSNVSIRFSDTSCGSDLSDNNGDSEFKSGIVQMNGDSQNSHSSACSHENVLGLLKTFAELSWESQCKAVEDVKNKLEGNDQEYLWATSKNYVNPLIKFMNDARELCDIKAQREGAEVLLAILDKNRSEMPPLQGDDIYALTSYLDSEIIGDALAIIELLSYEQYCQPMMLVSGVLPPVLKILETQIREFHTLAMKILCNLSTNSEIGYHMVYLDYIPGLVRFLDDPALSRYSIEIIKNLCSIEETRVAVAENIECVVAIGKLLEQGIEEQEHALDILLSLCHEGAEYCQLVMREDIVESLVHISVNGNSKGKLIALELLKLFGDKTCANASEPSTPNAPLEVHTSSSCESKRKRSSSRAFWFLGRDVSIFSKS
ncbi:Coatomer beta subunit, partial [Parasponia andersonii]